MSETEIPEDIIRDMFGFAAPTEQQLSSIGVWATKALELKAHIAQVEEQLKMLETELNVIETVNLSQALLDAGVTEFSMKDGSKIKIKDVIRNGLSKDPAQRQTTFDWVTDNGGKEIIKDHFEIDYNKGYYEEALKLRHLLQEHHIDFDEFESIHAQTLWAFLREKLDEGIVPPFDDMGLYYAKHAVVTPPKVKK